MYILNILYLVSLNAANQIFKEEGLESGGELASAETEEMAKIVKENGSDGLVSAETEEAAQKRKTLKRKRHFCKCGKVKRDSLAYCLGPNCPYKWFHFSCAGIKVLPVPFFCCDKCRDEDLAAAKYNEEKEKHEMAKMSKMEPQMQDENVSNENIQNEFDNDQEPFDGTNVKEEMSEPIILQINTLNELNNTQTVNHREEREGNQESGILVVENVVFGNEMEDIKEIPEIKKEVKGEPEIVTLDDEVETNEVQPEIKQESVAESYHFDVPSGAFFRSILGKFNIDISNEVYTFYGNNIKYTKIPATATLCTTFPTSSSIDSFFKCLSLYFTGKEEHFSVIKMGIQAYFYNNSKTFGIIDGIDFSKLKKCSPEFQKLHKCNELTNAHFTLICSWFNCRIGIFSNGRLSGKYGNWNGNEPIFLIENNNGFYKAILSFN